MKTAYLYRTAADRNREFIGAVEVPDDVFADTERNYKTSWCAENGYDSSHYLRARKVIETTDAERRAMYRAHDRLKAEGKLPSAATVIASKAGRLSTRIR